MSKTELLENLKNVLVDSLVSVAEDIRSSFLSLRFKTMKDECPSLDQETFEDVQKKTREFTTEIITEEITKLVDDSLLESFDSIFRRHIKVNRTNKEKDHSV